AVALSINSDTFMSCPPSSGEPCPATRLPGFSHVVGGGVRLVELESLKLRPQLSCVELSPRQARGHGVQVEAFVTSVLVLLANHGGDKLQSLVLRPRAERNVLAALGSSLRSEERRVGKECRSWW